MNGRYGRQPESASGCEIGGGNMLVIWSYVRAGCWRLGGVCVRVSVCVIVYEWNFIGTGDRYLAFRRRRRRGRTSEEHRPWRVSLSNCCAFCWIFDPHKSCMSWVVCKSRYGGGEMNKGSQKLKHIWICKRLTTRSNGWNAEGKRNMCQGYQIYFPNRLTKLWNWGKFLSTVADCKIKPLRFGLFENICAVAECKFGSSWLLTRNNPLLLS